MTMHDNEFDPDDNFAHAFDGSGRDSDDEASVEQLAWQLLLLINPGDEDAAMQQFAGWQEGWQSDAGDLADAFAALQDVSDWKSSFRVDKGENGPLIDSLNELAARWNLRIDWGVEDPGDDEFLAAADAGSLIAIAYDRLREHGYTVWTWNSSASSDEDVPAGCITLTRDEEAIQQIAPELGIDLQRGNA